MYKIYIYVYVRLPHSLTKLIPTLLLIHSLNIEFINGWRWTKRKKNIKKPDSKTHHLFSLCVIFAWISISKPLKTSQFELHRRFVLFFFLNFESHLNHKVNEWIVTLNIITSDFHIENKNRVIGNGINWLWYLIYSIMSN